ncbi:MAG: metallophosphoesterase [Pseudomonadota bacterium]
MHQADGWYIDDITVRGKEEQRLDTVVFSESFDGGAGVVADLPWLVSGGRLADGLLGAPAPALAQARLAQPLDFSGLLRAELSFLLERALGTGELLLVEASTDGELWREVARYAGAAPAAHERVTLDAYAGQPRVFVRFVLATTSTPPSRRVAIDDLSVLGLPLPDACPDDPEKLEPGICGCGVADTDTDADGTADCLDACPEDAHKVEPGVCGCGVADEDTDGTGTTDCLEPDPEILVARNAVWRYLDDGSDVSAAFRVPSFDDGAWASGPAELGFGDGDEATVVSAGPTGARNIAVYFRHAFTVRNPAMIRTLVLELVRDDGAVVYLNGVEAFRTNMPSGPIDGTTLAVNAIAGAAESTPVVAELSPALLVPGRNVLAVQVHQNVASSSDLSFWLELRQISLDECPDDPDKMEPGVCGCGTPDVDEDANGTVDCLETCSPQFCDDGDPCTEESCDAAGACVHTWTCDGVPRGALWSYLDDGSALEPSWVTPEYDDSGWQRGFAELGYGDGDEATVVAEGPPGGPRAITTYFRKRFTVADRASITALRLDLVRDDGAVVYLNGTEVFRSNMPAGPVTASTLASSAIGGSAESAVVSTGVDPALLVDGENVLAVEIHQNAADSSDISFDLALVPVRGGPFDPEGVPLLAAGDIGDCNTTADTATGLLLDRHEGLIAVLGDVAYPSGSANDFANCFDPVWGRHRDRMRPVPGNHEYITPGASAYYAYFGDLAGDPQRGYYSYDLGEWHIVALNSNCTQIADDAAPPPAHGCAEGSTQLEWLRADLAANPRLCTLAYFHHPRFSSGRHGDEPMMSAIWDVLMEAGVDVVLSGHEHDYERTVPLTNQRTPGENGIPQFIVGTGGTALRTFAGAAPPTTVVRDSTTHGILELRLRPTDYSFRFIPIDGGTFTDSGTAACR